MRDVSGATDVKAVGVAINRLLSLRPSHHTRLQPLYDAEFPEGSCSPGELVVVIAFSEKLLNRLAVRDGCRGDGAMKRHIWETEAQKHLEGKVKRVFGDLDA